MRRVGVLAAIAYAVLVGAFMVTFSPELLLPAIQLPLLVWATSAIARRVARSTGDATHYALIVGAFKAKMLGTLVRMAVNEVFYNGLTDALDYNSWGVKLAPSYRVLDFSPPVGKVQGTGFFRVVTGVVYSFWGDSVLGASLLLSWLAFIGLLLFWLAFRRGVRDGSDRRYALLVFFIPSLLYWPSALGKDAFAVFLLGVISYGLSRAMTSNIFSGLCLALSGTYAVMLLRPHVALTVACGVLLALAFGRSKGSAARGNLLRMVGCCILALATMVLMARTESFFGVKSLDSESIAQTLDSTSTRTDDAGSSFTPVRMDNPATTVPAIITVLFRPFPMEAGSLVGIIASLEGIFLLVLTIRSRRRFQNLVRSMRESPYVGYALGMALAFVFAFSSFSNFGILARQRVQMLPLFFVLLCLSPRGAKTERVAASATADGHGEPREDCPPNGWNQGLSAVPDSGSGATVGSITREKHDDPYRYCDRTDAVLWSSESAPALEIGSDQSGFAFTQAGRSEEVPTRFHWESRVGSYRWSDENTADVPLAGVPINNFASEPRLDPPSQAGPASGAQRESLPRRSVSIAVGQPYVHEVRVKGSADGSETDLSGHAFVAESFVAGMAVAFDTYDVDVRDPAAGVIIVLLTSAQTDRLARANGPTKRILIRSDPEDGFGSVLELDVVMTPVHRDDRQMMEGDPEVAVDETTSDARGGQRLQMDSGADGWVTGRNFGSINPGLEAEEPDAVKPMITRVASESTVKSGANDTGGNIESESCASDNSPGSLVPVRGELVDAGESSDTGFWRIDSALVVDDLLPEL